MTSSNKLGSRAFSSKRDDVKGHRQLAGVVVEVDQRRRVTTATGSQELSVVFVVRYAGYRGHGYGKSVVGQYPSKRTSTAGS